MIRFIYNQITTIQEILELDDNAARDKKKARFISSITSKSLLKLAI